MADQRFRDQATLFVVDIDDDDNVDVDIVLSLTAQTESHAVD